MMSSVGVSFILFLLVITALPTGFADFSILPMKGYVSFGLELIVGEPDSSSPVDLFTMSMSGILNNSYPLRIEKVSLSDKTVYLYNDNEIATINSDNKCLSKKNTIKSDDVALWDAIRTILMAVDKTISQSTVYDRGLESMLLSDKELRLTIPKKFKGNGELQLYSVSVFLLHPWNVNYMHVKDLPVKIVLTDDENHKWYFTFFDFALSTIDTRDFIFPSVCVERSVFAKVEVIQESTGNPKMPGFPEEFSAEIQVIMPSERVMFTMHERFSSLLRLSHSSVYSAIPDEVGRVTTYDWYIIGSYQMAYLNTKSILPHGQDSPIPGNLRDYFWPDTEGCIRTQISFDVISGSVATLMLYSSDIPPVYIGSHIVRGVPCKVWSASLSGVRVKWFWADREKVNLNDNNSTDDMDVLMRIVVEGKGAAPFYVHHPFLAQGKPLPSQHRSSACRLLTPWDPACRNNNENYKYTYDITSFSRYVSSNDFVLPTTCRSSDVPSATIPDIKCRPASASSTITLTLTLFLVGILLGSCIVWFRYGVIVHKLRKELLLLALENERQRRSAQQNTTS
ncbi:hypothetical protein LSM04_009177 [Trypanosoma melophagium]|uniref:uncharacterized protein n=1 Tax=Trypanosoma melophagium TaxID=715481 RepID=UPI00351A0C67|nr:hypothetical protein LSM04_009177 [Trypanosoma melophagium]